MDNTIENMINSIDLSAPVPEYEPMRPVSYTHLDVYKRQVQCNSSTGAYDKDYGCE